jgi:hypothetical protein
MSCNTRRDLEYEKEVEREEERKRKEKQKRKKQLEKERREKALQVIKEQAAKLKWILTKEKSPFHQNEFTMTKPGSKDLMKIKVNDDGTVTVDTPGTISPQNHPSADAFMATVADILKGKWAVVERYISGTLNRTGAHSHDHAHTHFH